MLPTNDAALDGLRARLAAWGIPADAWQIIDGSGLSRRDAIAPEALVAILRRMYEPSGGSPWMTALPVAGRDGTLAGRMAGTPAEGNVRAKTGTMSNIRTLAGYVRTRDGENACFCHPRRQLRRVRRRRCRRDRQDRDPAGGIQPVKDGH